MARAAELPDGRIHRPLRMLHAFLALAEWIAVGDDMALLPYGEVLRFVDPACVSDIAPSGAGFHGWRPGNDPHTKQTASFRFAPAAT